MGNEQDIQDKLNNVISYIVANVGRFKDMTFTEVFSSINRNSNLGVADFYHLFTVHEQIFNSFGIERREAKLGGYDYFYNGELLYKK